jgi:SAM-dependent methyltransferase
MEHMLKAEKDFTVEYDRSWSKYDFIVNLFQLGRDSIHRRRALRLAGLKKGDTVLDLCCGSGLSLKAIQGIIGPEGKIIAVDGNKHMLELARSRAVKHSWDNIEFVHGNIEDLDIEQQVDFALFALCWYDKDLCEGWVKKVSEFMNAEDGRICFIDYKLPENRLRVIINPLINILIKWLGEAYGLEDLKWNPRQEIGSVLNDARYTSYYLDCIVAVWGKPKQ